MRRGEDLAGLWQAKENGCEKARERLYQRFEPLVSKTRKRGFPTAPERLWEDMESDGRLALLKAVDRFDRSRGVQFTSFAIMWLRAAMSETLRRDDWVTRAERAKEKAGKPALIRQVLSLTTLYEQPDGEGLPLVERLASGEEPVDAQVMDRLEQQQLETSLNRVLHSLGRTDRRYLDLRYRESMSMRQIAAHLGWPLYMTRRYWYRLERRLRYLRQREEAAWGD